MFLPSILPDVFRTLGLNHKEALHWAGIIITLYTITSMIGTYLWCSLVPKIAAQKLITALMIGGILLQGLLIFPQGLFSFSVIRMIQTGLIAAVIPLSVALYADKASGFTMGFLYSSRFVGNAIGPILATSLVAFSSIPTLYAFICGLSLIILVVFQILKTKVSTIAAP
jgi:MFS family permease